MSRGAGKRSQILCRRVQRISGTPLSQPPPPPPTPPQPQPLVQRVVRLFSPEVATVFGAGAALVLSAHYLSRIEHRHAAAIERLRAEMGGVEGRVNATMAGVSSAMDAKVAGVSSAVDAKVAGVAVTARAAALEVLKDYGVTVAGGRAGVE